MVVHILICLNLFLIESGGTIGWLLCPRPNHSWTNGLQAEAWAALAHEDDDGDGDGDDGDDGYDDGDNDNADDGDDGNDDGNYC